MSFFPRHSFFGEKKLFCHSPCLLLPHSYALCFAGYIDLSKRRVSHEEVLKCEENFAKGKAVSSILSSIGGNYF